MKYTDLEIVRPDAKSKKFMWNVVVIIIAIITMMIM